MLRAAVFPSRGIGDALLMMIASHQLKEKGYFVTTYHDFLPELLPWFPGHEIHPTYAKNLSETLDSCDLIIAENDNSSRIKQLIETCRERLSIFYPTYLGTKHAPLSSLDFVFNADLPMAENIALCTAKLMHLPSPSKDNGITAPPSLVFCSKQTQVLIHPTSSCPTKNWKRAGYLKVASMLKKKGLNPLFCVGPEEHSEWKCIEQEGFCLSHLPTLADLATLVYESGFVIGNDSLIGHLASNLGIPTLIIANDEKRMRLWRPGWHPGQLVLPPSYLPNWKFLRLKDRRWQSFISARKVFKHFDTLNSPN